MKHLLLLLSMSIGLSACVVHGLPPAENLRVVKRAVPEYKKPQSLNIINYYKKTTMAVFPDMDGGPLNIEYDLKKFTYSAIKLVTQGVEHQSIHVTGKSKKSVTLSIVDITRKMGWNTSTYHISMNVELSNGVSFKVKAKGVGRSSSMLKVSEKFLQHPTFVKFMN